MKNMELLRLENCSDVRKGKRRKGGTVGAESVAKEEGVICIFPMQMKEKPNIIRIIEIYRSEEAYKAHLQTPHFRTYKDGTPHMIKSLKLVPMSPLDAENMGLIFKKLK